MAAVRSSHSLHAIDSVHHLSSGVREHAQERVTASLLIQAVEDLPPSPSMRTVLKIDRCTHLLFPFRTPSFLFPPFLTPVKHQARRGGGGGGSGVIRHNGSPSLLLTCPSL